MSVFDRFMPANQKFFADLRTGGVKHYDCDPLVEVYKLRDNVFSILSLSPGMGGDAWMHLVIGPERAMLIDTGFGIGDLKALVETLTDKPYIVVNTHFHGDHTFGNYQFDKVYCHKFDADTLLTQMKPEARKGFVPTEGVYFKPEDLVPIREYEVIAVDHGYIFDLGAGYEVELVHLPGHAPGGCGFLDKTGRILYSGDAIVATPTMISGSAQGNPHADAMTITSFRDRLVELAKRTGEFDTLFPGHAILDYPAKAVDDMLELCNKVIADPNCQDDISTTMGDRGNAKLKVVGLASVAYTDDRI